MAGDRARPRTGFGLQRFGLEHVNVAIDSWIGDDDVHSNAFGSNLSLRLLSVMFRTSPAGPLANWTTRRGLPRNLRRQRPAVRSYNATIWF